MRPHHLEIGNASIRIAVFTDTHGVCDRRHECVRRRAQTTSPAGVNAGAPDADQWSHPDLAAMTFASIDVPGSTGTFALDINASGDVVGRCVIGGQTHGFLRGANGDFTTIDFPGASFTVAAGINDAGDIVGMYALPTAPTERHGFVLHAGSFTTIDPDGSKFTNALGINPKGDVVGRYCTKVPCGPPGNGTYHGFIWQDGDITTFDVPGSKETNAWKVNPKGEVLGAFRLADNIGHLYVLRGTNLTTFDLPGVLPIAQDNGGINPRGDVVGQYCNALPCVNPASAAHGFVLSGDNLTTIDFPGAAATGVFGINPSGDIAGGYIDAAGKNHGFMVNKKT